MTGPHRGLTRRDLLWNTSHGAAAVGLGAAATACSPFGSTVDGDEGTLRMISPADLGRERQLMKQAIADFEKANSSVTVNITFEAWDDYMTKLPTILAGGSIPDVVHQHMSIVQDYGHRGALLDLTSMLRDAGLERSDFVTPLFDAFANGDKLYGVPKDSAAWGVYYNKAKFDEAGVDYPKQEWTTDDFRKIARRLTKDRTGRSPGDNGFDPQQINQWGLSWMEPTPVESENTRAFLRALGGDWYDAKHIRTRINEKPALQHFELFRAMRCDDRSTPSPAQDLGQGDPFRSGLTAMSVSHHNQDYFLRQEKVDFEWGIAFIPSGPGGQFVPVGCSGWAIPAQSENQDDAWKLVQHLISPKVQRSFAVEKRWAPALPETLEQIVPSDPVDGFAEVHVDPLRGQGSREAISFRFPPDQSKIQEVYSNHFDEIWDTCSTTDVRGAARASKRAIDDILANS